MLQKFAAAFLFVIACAAGVFVFAPSKKILKMGSRESASERRYIPKGAGTNCPTEVFEPVRMLQQSLQKSAGGGEFCEDINEEELDSHEVQSVVKLGRPIQLMDNFNDLSVRMIFQDIARNSQVQALNRLAFLNDATSANSNAQKLEAAAAVAYQIIVEDLHDLVVLHHQYAAHLNDLDASYDRGTSYDHAKFREADNAAIAELDKVITKLALNVPMGFEPEVAQSLVAMSRSNNFSAMLFRQGLENAKKKYLETIKYYETKTIPLSRDGKIYYCLGLDYANMAAETGEMNRWLSQLPTRTAIDRSFQKKVTCQMTATFDSGATRVRHVFGAAGFVSMFIPFVDFAAAGSLGAAAVGTINAAGWVSMAIMLNRLEHECFGSGDVISGDRSYDPSKDYGHFIEAPQTSSCVKGALSLASLSLPIRSAFLAVKAARAPRIQTPTSN